MAKDPLENLREKAQEALSHGQYQEARQLYQQALGYRSDHPDLHYGIATVCFVLADLHSAIYHFKEVIRLDPMRAGAHVNLGAVYNRLGQYEDALASLRRGIQLDTNRAEGYYNLGLVYKHLGQLELAVNAYREAVRVNPRMYDAHYNLGNIFFEKGQHAHAIAHYRQALEVRPNWEKAKNALETVLAEQQARQPGEPEQEPTPPPKAAVPAPKAPKLDPNRSLDPSVHGKCMQDLHHLVIDMDEQSQTMLEFLHGEVERSIRELSMCVLTPNDPHHNLDDQLQKIDQAIARIQQMQDGLHKRMAHVRLISDQIAKT